MRLEKVEHLRAHKGAQTDGHKLKHIISINVTFRINDYL